MRLICFFFRCFIQISVDGIDFYYIAVLSARLHDLYHVLLLHCCCENVFSSSAYNFVPMCTVCGSKQSSEYFLSFVQNKGISKLTELNVSVVIQTERRFKENCYNDYGTGVLFYFLWFVGYTYKNHYRPRCPLHSNIYSKQFARDFNRIYVCHNSDHNRTFA